MEPIYKVLAVLCFLAAAIGASAQNTEVSNRAQGRMNAAEAHFNANNYQKSILFYKEVLKRESDNITAKLRLAQAYRSLHDMVNAEKYYRQIINSDKVYEDIHQLHFAEVLMVNEKYDEARTWLERYGASHPDDKRFRERLKGLDHLDSFYDRKSLYSVEALHINTDKSEFAPAFYDEGIVFLSSRTKAGLKKKDKRTNSAFLDFYYASLDENGDLTSPKVFSKDLNSKYNEGPLAFYGDQSRAIITRNVTDKKKVVKANQNVRNLKLFEVEVDDKGWSSPKELNINNDKYSVGHPTLSADGKTLYFTSNMPGGMGGTDLYKSENKGGRWTTPQNLGWGINTEGDEMFPFLHNDSVLYFSSNGHEGLGGLDIYKVSLGQLSADGIENLGHPVNSNRDDFGLVLAEDGEYGYFASERDGGKGEDDLYKVVVSISEPEVIEPILAQIEEEVPEPEEVVFYTVQILALLNPEVVERSFLQDLNGVLFHDGRDGFHRYTHGVYSTKEEAMHSLHIMKNRGYDDAFIRAVKRYEQLSFSPGVNVERLYGQETHITLRD